MPGPRSYPCTSSRNLPRLPRPLEGLVSVRRAIRGHLRRDGREAPGSGLSTYGDRLESREHTR